MEIDLVAEKALLDTQMLELAKAMQALDQQRQTIANAIVRCQGGLELLQQLFDREGAGGSDAK